MIHQILGDQVVDRAPTHTQVLFADYLLNLGIDSSDSFCIPTSGSGHTAFNRLTRKAIDNRHIDGQFGYADRLLQMQRTGQPDGFHGCIVERLVAGTPMYLHFRQVSVGSNDCAQ